MAANVPRFTEAVDEVFKSFSTQDVQIDLQETKGLGERGTKKHIEQKYKEQLQRARAAFLQEFRNHSVVVAHEVSKIREELTERMEEKYGEKIAQFKRDAAEAASIVQRHVDEIAQLKKLASSQETYLAAVRHRWGLDQKEQMRGEIIQLREELDGARKEIADLSHQLVCRDDLVTQLGAELSTLEGELKRQASSFAEEKRSYDERLRSLRQEMRQQQDQFRTHLQDYEGQFADFRRKTNAELQIQDILNNRRSEALALMEEERQRHIQARTKPTPRIAVEGDEDEQFVPYEMAKDARYRVDDMGMDTAWRDYKLGSDSPLVPVGQTHRKRPLPKFRVERITRAAAAAENMPSSLVTKAIGVATGSTGAGTCIGTATGPAAQLDSLPMP